MNQMPSFPLWGLEGTTGTPPYYVDEDYPAGPEINEPLPEWSNWRGSELSTLEIDVYVGRNALIMVHARDEWINEWSQAIQSAFDTILSSVHLSVCDNVYCTVALTVGVVVESCSIMFLGEDFLFICSHFCFRMYCVATMQHSRHLELMTGQSMHGYWLLEEQSYQISSRSDLKWYSLRLFLEEIAPTRTITTRTKWLVISVPNPKTESESSSIRSSSRTGTSRSSSSIHCKQHC